MASLRVARLNSECMFRGVNARLLELQCRQVLVFCVAPVLQTM